MRCIFCKYNSVSSKSIEHIIPESLGNLEHILPAGIVCDKCNNYFASKLEKPLLESYYFIYTRFENLIPSKKGRIPKVKGFISKSLSVVDVEITSDGPRIVLNKEDVPRYLENATGKGNLYILHPEKPDDDIKRIMSRFLGKAAIEVLAQRVLKIPQAIDVDVIDNVELDELRNYVRYGNGEANWPYHYREIYPANAMFFSEEDNDYYDVPHEYTLLFTDDKELYLVIAIFGIEYTINMGGPELEGYYGWLKKNNDKSVLYKDDLDYKFTCGAVANIKNGSLIDVYMRQ